MLGRGFRVWLGGLGFRIHVRLCWHASTKSLFGFVSPIKVEVLGVRKFAGERLVQGPKTCYTVIVYGEFQRL